MSAAHIPTRVMVEHSAVRFQADMGPIVARYLAGFDLLGRLHVMQAMKKKTGDVRGSTRRARPRSMTACSDSRACHRRARSITCAASPE
jgi:hypothetical protein